MKDKVSNFLFGDAGKAEKPRTPSMDDKHTPSPPVLTTEQYEANKRAGIVRGGKPIDAKDLKP